MLQVQTDTNAPWKKRYRAPAIFFTTIAPQAPDRGLVWTNQSGTLQFHAWNPQTGELKQITHTQGGHNTFLHLSPDGKWLYYLKDEHGNEIGHYVRMPYASGEPEDITPDMPPYSSYGFSFSRAGNRLGYMTADAEGFTAYIVDIDDRGGLSAPRVLYHSRTICFGPAFSADGSVVVMMHSEHSGKNEFALLAFDAATGAKLNELWDGEGTNIGVQLTSPVPGDPRLLASSNRSGIERLLVWDPRTGERADLPLEEISGAQNADDWSPDGQTMLFSAMDQAVQSVNTYSFASRQVKKLDTPEGEYRPYFTPDGQKVYAIWNDASHPNRLVELDPVTGSITRTVLQAGDAPQGQPFKSVSFPGAKGDTIQGWLCVPPGPGPFPTILETHGGPTGVTGPGFHASAQAWVDHGFAFLTINYHGSITFGREFEKSIWGKLGDLEAEDLAGAQAFLVKSGVADPKAIFLTGWSYGGYLTLLGLGKHPELWAGGMAGIAIADWAVLWEDSADTLRGYQEALFGGTPQDLPERYQLSSPIHYVGQVRAPVLIIQGRNDTRTPARPVEMYEAKMKEAGKQISVHWYETGHMGSFADVELGIAHQQMMMEFACGVL